MLYGVANQIFYARLYDTAGAEVTGGTTNCYLSKDGATATSLSAGSYVTNIGWKLDTGAAANTEALGVSLSWENSGALPVTQNHQTRVNSYQWRDFEINTPTNPGVPEVDATHWKGSGLVAVTVNGVPKVDASYLTGVSLIGNQAHLSLKTISVLNDSATGPAVDIQQQAGDYPALYLIGRPGLQCSSGLSTHSAAVFQNYGALYAIDATGGGIAGSISGNISGNVTGSVGSVTGGALEATSQIIVGRVNNITSGVVSAVPFTANADNSSGPIIGGTTIIGTILHDYSYTYTDNTSYHTITSVGEAIDIVYGFNVGTSNAIKVTFNGAFFATLPIAGKFMDIYAWNFTGTPAWEKIGTIAGQQIIAGIQDVTIEAALLSSHTGTGADDGDVYIRFVAATGANQLQVDQLLVQAQMLGGDAMTLTSAYDAAKSAASQASVDSIVNALPPNFAALTINAGGYADANVTAVAGTVSASWPVPGYLPSDIQYWNGLSLDANNAIVKFQSVSVAAGATASAVSLTSSHNNGVVYMAATNGDAFNVSGAFTITSANGNGTIQIANSQGGTPSAPAVKISSTRDSATGATIEVVNTKFAATYGAALYIQGSTASATGKDIQLGGDGKITGSLTGSVGSVSGGVTVSTNNDKTGYSLTQSFPPNFSLLSIDGTGQVTATNGGSGATPEQIWTYAGTRSITDKTGFSLSQAFPSNFEDLAITATTGYVTATNGGGAASPITYPPTSATRNASDPAGDSGTYTDLISRDDVPMVTAEDLTVGLELTVVCATSEVDEYPSLARIRGYYGGPQQHEVFIEAWNFVSAGWDRLAHMHNRTTPFDYVVPLTSSHHDAVTGEMRLHFIHSGGGYNSGDDLTLDWVQFEKLPMGDTLATDVAQILSLIGAPADQSLSRDIANLAANVAPTAATPYLPTDLDLTVQGGVVGGLSDILARDASAFSAYETDQNGAGLEIGVSVDTTDLAESPSLVRIKAFFDANAHTDHFLHVEAFNTFTSGWERIGVLENRGNVGYTEYVFPLRVEHHAAVTGEMKIRFIHNVVTYDSNDILWINWVSFEKMPMENQTATDIAHVLSIIGKPANTTAAVDTAEVLATIEAGAGDVTSINGQALNDYLATVKLKELLVGRIELDPSAAGLTSSSALTIQKTSGDAVPLIDIQQGTNQCAVSVEGNPGTPAILLANSGGLVYYITSGALPYHGLVEDASASPIQVSASNVMTGGDLSQLRMRLAIDGTQATPGGALAAGTVSGYSQIAGIPQAVANTSGLYMGVSSLSTMIGWMAAKIGSDWVGKMDHDTAIKPTISVVGDASMDDVTLTIGSSRVPNKDNVVWGTWTKAGGWTWSQEGDPPVDAWELHADAYDFWVISVNNGGASEMPDRSIELTYTGSNTRVITLTFNLQPAPAGSDRTWYGPDANGNMYEWSYDSANPRIQNQTGAGASAADVWAHVISGSDSAATVLNSVQSKVIRDATITMNVDDKPSTMVFSDGRKLTFNYVGNQVLITEGPA